MDGLKLQAKAYRGYAKSAAKTGLLHRHYRPSGSTYPLSEANRLMPGLAVLADRHTGNFKFNAPDGHGKPYLDALADGTALHVGDYLLPVADGEALFVGAMPHIAPILVVQCNRTVSLLRPGVVDTAYLGDVQAEEVAHLSGWPCSLLAGTKGESNTSGLPTETRTPWFSVLLPASPDGFVIKTNDLMTDDLGHRYEVSSAELSALGWRLSVSQKDV